MGAKPTARLAAILALLRKPVDKLAAEWGVDRGHLVNLKHGRSSVGAETALRFQDRLGVSPRWLREGEGPIFLPGRSPGENIERAIERQITHGPPRTSAVPVFESVEEVDLEYVANEIWHDHPLRGLMPVAAVNKEGFYVRVNDRQNATILGCQTGDWVLFLPTGLFYKRTRVRVDDECSCIVKCRRRVRAYRFEVIDVRTRRQEKLKTGFRPPRTNEYQIRYEAGDGTKYYLRKTAPQNMLFGGGKVIAVAVRAERDLVHRKGETSG